MWLFEEFFDFLYKIGGEDWWIFLDFSGGGYIGCLLLILLYVRDLE